MVERMNKGAKDGRRNEGADGRGRMNGCKKKDMSKLASLACT